MGDKNFSKGIAFFLALLLSSYCIAFTDDELISVRVCGDALYGKNPCEWVKNIEVSVSYLGENTTFKQKLTGLVENWVGDRIWLIPETSNIVVKEKSGWFYFKQPERKSINVNVVVYDLEDNKNNPVLSIVTSTSEKYQVFSYSCPYPSEEKIRKCISDKIDKGLSLLLDGSYTLR